MSLNLYRFIPLNVQFLRGLFLGCFFLTLYQHVTTPATTASQKAHHSNNDTPARPQHTLKHEQLWSAQSRGGRANFTSIVQVLYKMRMM